MSDASQFRHKLLDDIIATDNASSITIAGGIIRVKFKDDSMVDFTEPSVTEPEKEEAVPDLTTVTVLTCKSNIKFKTTIVGSKGAEYDVEWRKNSNLEVSTEFRAPRSWYGWRCECKAFEFGGGKHCKHIFAVIKSGDRCAWNEELDPGALSNEGVACPKCGGPIESIQVGV